MNSRCPSLRLFPNKWPSKDFFTCRKIFLLFFVWVCCFFNFFTLCSVYGEELTYHTGDRRDPFVPLVGPDGIMMLKGKTSDFVVEGIIFDPREGSLALINGEMYKPGDSVNEAVIIQIFKDRVLLSIEDEEKIIWLREELADKDTTV